jgi:hypothetical protein
MITIKSLVFHHYATRAQPRNSFLHFLFSGINGGIGTSIRGFRVKCCTTMLGFRDKCFTTMQPLHSQETLFAFCYLPVVSGIIGISIIRFRVKCSTTMLPGHNQETLFSILFFLALAVGLEPLSEDSESSVLPLCNQETLFVIYFPWCQWRY